MVSSRLGRVFAAGLLAVLTGVLMQIAPAANVVHAATAEVTPASDAWVNRQRPDTNYGSARALRAAATESEAVLRFRTEPWFGQPVTGLTLTLQTVGGNPAGLSVDEASNSWKESTVTWRTRPPSLSSLDSTPAARTTGVSFDVSDLFSRGVVDRNVIALRVRNASPDPVTFGSRESDTPARLKLDSTTRTAQPERLRPVADTWADSTRDAKTHGGNSSLYVDGNPRQEAFLLFDLSAWQGMPYKKLELRLQVDTGGGPGVRVHRIASTWSESNLTWLNRPTGGSLVADLPAPVSSGPLALDITSAFASGEIEARKLSLRVTTTGGDRFGFSAREGVAPPVLLLTPEATPTPSPSAAPTATARATPTASPTASPTATPTASPTATPTASPTATPTASPTATPTASPTATPTGSPAASPTPDVIPPPEPLFYFDGRGTDHGVGMSQQGAKGRAAAGQTYDQILSFYYSGVAFSQIDGGTPIRVLLSDDFMPSATMPARVGAYLGDWQSAAFPGITFPQGSYVEMWPPSPTASTALWVATVYDSLGNVLASAETNDLVVEAIDSQGLLEMRFRDEISKYRLYRGRMRLLVTTTGLQAINILPMESYLRGVVPAEVPATWPIEAVKTQAVAARTYAWARLKGDDRAWDVVPTAANQVYGGYQHESPRSDIAVLATKNIVLTYQGNIISALFHACAGGHTENSEYAFVNDKGDPGSRVPYLRGKPDVDENGVPYDAGAGTFAWNSGHFTMAELSQIMAGNAATNVGEIFNITFQRGVSGRVYKVVLVGSGGMKEVSGGKFKSVYNNFRTPGSPNMDSNLFFLTPVAT